VTQVKANKKINPNYLFAFDLPSQKTNKKWEGAPQHLPRKAFQKKEK
jgi:hypothetical protein